MDHKLSSIQDYIDPKILKDYHCVDLSLQSENIWQTKMLRTKIDEKSYFLDPFNASDDVTRKLLEQIKREMRGILHMWPD